MLIQYVKEKADNISCRSDKINVGSPANMIAFSDFIVGSSDKISYPTYTSESRLYMSGLPTLHLRIFRRKSVGYYGTEKTEIPIFKFKFIGKSDLYDGDVAVYFGCRNSRGKKSEVPTTEVFCGISDIYVCFSEEYVGCRKEHFAFFTV